MPSFDIVSEIDAVELRNSVENSTRELASRFDFRNVDDFQLGQMMDILRGNLAKRGVDARAMKAKDSVHIGKNWYKEAEFKQGLEALLAKKIVKLIKDAKIKVQASIQGDKVRVTGKKRDDLQEVMAMLREANLEQPLQYNNFRE